MNSDEVKNMDLIRVYESEYPFDVEISRRAWRVAFTFDRMDLFYSALIRAISNGNVADWSCVFSISEDVDMSYISEYRKGWPDPSYLRALGES